MILSCNTLRIKRTPKLCDVLVLSRALDLYTLYKQELRVIRYAKLVCNLISYHTVNSILRYTLDVVPTYSIEFQVRNVSSHVITYDINLFSFCGRNNLCY